MYRIVGIGWNYLDYYYTIAYVSPEYLNLYRFYVCTRDDIEKFTAYVFCEFCERYNKTFVISFIAILIFHIRVRDFIYYII